MVPQLYMSESMPPEWPRNSLASSSYNGFASAGRPSAKGIGTPTYLSSRSDMTGPPIPDLHGADLVQRNDH
ncbi:hypothetical protein GCM10009798_06610 [Nocardioides panacihumi]|uniref:Uncharacterized protein n=1 Tax=Nocardioides panacihumi TaxID=400774 RepID=A0ABP5BRF5_9ACTN